jgi:hypothetical protein
MNSIVIPGKLAVASATGIQELKRNLDTGLRRYDGWVLSSYLSNF